MLGPATYQAFTGRMFVAPPDPGATPNIPANTTVANTNRLVREHTAALKTYQEYTCTDIALKQQILDTYDDVYLQDLQNRHTGYATTSALQLIQHLYTAYGQIDQTSLSENTASINTPYDPSTRIQHLFRQIEDAMDFADAANAPFTDA